MADKSKAITQHFDCAVEVAGLPVIARSVTLKSEYEYASFGEDEGMTGSQYPVKGSRVLVKEDISGDIVLHPTMAQAKAIMALFFTNTGYTLKDDPSGDTSTIKVDHNTGAKTYEGAWLNTLKITANENGAVEFALSFLGASSTGSATIGAITHAEPIIGADCTLTMGADTYFAIGTEITLTRNLDSRFYLGSLTRSSVCAGKFSATGNINIDLNVDTEALLAYQGTNTSIAMALAMVQDAASITLAFPEILFTGSLPDLADGPIQPSLEWAASKPSASPIVTCTVV
jgi:hypothetical protein